MSLVSEIWKDVVGYEGIYQVSNYGNVRSIDRIIKRGNHSFTKKGQIKATGINNRGYCDIMLCKGAKYEHHVVHKLVALAFIPNPENKDFINHKNGNKLNNCVDNIEWVTMSENNQHAYNTGLKIGAATGKFGELNHSSKAICMVNKTTGKVIKEFSAIHDAAREMKLSATGICAAIKGRSSSCGGYKWIYKTQNKAA